MNLIRIHTKGIYIHSSLDIYKLLNFKMKKQLKLEIMKQFFHLNFN
jgi:hypothetical protein